MPVRSAWLAIASTTPGTLSSTPRGALGPLMSVRTQPGAMTTRPMQLAAPIGGGSPPRLAAVDDPSSNSLWRNKARPCDRQLRPTVRAPAERGPLLPRNDPPQFRHGISFHGLVAATFPALTRARPRSPQGSPGRAQRPSPSSSSCRAQSASHSCPPPPARRGPSGRRSPRRGRPIGAGGLRSMRQAGLLR